MIIVFIQSLGIYKYENLPCRNKCQSKVETNCTVILPISIYKISECSLLKCLFHCSQIRPRMAFSVTRFGEISPLRQNKKSICANSWIGYLVFSKLLYQLWSFHAIEQIVIVVNGQRLNSIISIWSHWMSLKFRMSSTHARHLFLQFLSFLFQRLIQTEVSSWGRTVLGDLRTIEFSKRASHEDHSLYQSV